MIQASHSNAVHPIQRKKFLQSWKTWNRTFEWRFCRSHKSERREGEAGGGRERTIKTPRMQHICPESETEINSFSVKQKIKQQYIGKCKNVVIFPHRSFILCVACCTLHQRTNDTHNQRRIIRRYTNTQYPQTQGHRDIHTLAIFSARIRNTHIADSKFEIVACSRTQLRLWLARRWVGGGVVQGGGKCKIVIGGTTTRFSAQRTFSLPRSSKETHYTCLVLLMIHFEHFNSFRFPFSLFFALFSSYSNSTQSSMGNGVCVCVVQFSCFPFSYLSFFLWFSFFFLFVFLLFLFCFNDADDN